MRYLAFTPPAELLVSHLSDGTASADIEAPVGRAPSNGTDLGSTMRLAGRGDLLWAINYIWEAQSPPNVEGDLIVGKAGDVPAASVSVWKLR